MNKINFQRVAVFLDASEIGGIEQHVANLVIALQRDGRIEPYIILWRDYGNKDLIKRFGQCHCPVINLDGSLNYLQRILRKFQIDILHCHGYKANLIGRWMRVRYGIRTIATHHNGDLGQGRVRLYTWLDQLTARLSENWAVSEAILKRLPINSLLLPNFVEVSNAQLPSGTEIIFAGRLESVKRPDRILSIARLCPKIKFRVFGTGSMQNTLAQNCPKNVELMGFENRADVIWQNAALCLICSDAEGLPLVALEAMARGVPVISTPVGQLPALIDEGVNGWLASSDEDFSQVIQRWFSTAPAQRSRVRQNANKTIQADYSAEACLPQFLAAYQLF